MIPVKWERVRWLCGGIGLDERAALAKVDVILSDRDGKRSALKFTANGPICLVQAPPGRYPLEASYRDEKRSVSATVAKEAKQPGMVVFRFPGAE